jgi:catechol 2,3-dioxygenase-like lactoylglutathione lyase family enzyme
MIQVKRLGHATFNTPDLARIVDYWTRIMGLTVVEQGPKRAFLATKYGEESVVVEAGDNANLTRAAFQVAPGTDLADLQKSLGKTGIKSELRSDISPGVGKAIVFPDPKGTLCEIYSDYRHAARDTVEQGVMPLKFGHLAYRCKDPVKVTDFYTGVLGFKVSDWMGDRFSFLRCGRDHHTVNFARYEEERLHHMAFEVSDMAEVQRSSDFLARNGIQLVWGPIRHVVGHNIAAYHRNPDDQRVEIFAEMDIMRDEVLGYFEPRPWHEDFPQRPKVWPADTLRAYWGFGSFGQFPGYP